MVHEYFFPLGNILRRRETEPILPKFLLAQIEAAISFFGLKDFVK